MVTSGTTLEQNRTSFSVAACGGRKETELWQYSWSDRLRSCDNPAVGLKANWKQQQSPFLYKLTAGNGEYDGEGLKISTEAKSHTSADYTPGHRSTHYPAPRERQTPRALSVSKSRGT